MSEEEPYEWFPGLNPARKQLLIQIIQRERERREVRTIVNGQTVGQDSRHEIVIATGSELKTYLVAGNSIFACDLDGHPERYVGPLHLKHREG